MSGKSFGVARQWAVRPVSVASALLGFSLLGSPIAPAPAPAPAEVSVLLADSTCGSVPATVSKSHQINVVLDDSGSMFLAPSPQRWSYVKYALTVFAAMLGPSDEMKVFLLSQRGEVALTIRGSAEGPSQANVDAINALQMRGGGTPWAAVPVARDNLAASTAESRWLVLLSDGQFDDHVAAASEFSGWSASLSTPSRSYEVGFLGAGSGAPQLPAARGFYPANAPDDLDRILDTTADLANQIFGRAAIQPSGGSGSTIETDIDLATVLVLAQGDAEIGSPLGGVDQDQPFDLLAAPVDIPLPTNPPALANGSPVTAVAASGLTGQVATVADLPAGTTYFDVGGATQTNFYYTPRVQFGVTWVDPATGEPIPPGEAVVAGRYEIRYGFMDADCQIIGPERAALLGETSVTATMSKDGEVIEAELESGTAYDLTAGDMEVSVEGTYLGGNPAQATISQHIYPAPEYGEIRFDDAELAASTIGSGGTVRAIYVGEGGRAISGQEWDAVEVDSFTVTADPPAGLAWTVEKGERPGDLLLIPTSSSGNAFDVDTSQPVALTVTTDYVFDEGIKRAEGTVDLVLNDDIPWWERAGHWFATVGWMLLGALLALVLLLGYLFKKRFNRKFKRAPHVNSRPKTYGIPGGPSRGEFKKSLISVVLPFVPERATLRYAPGTAGFPRLQIRARRGRVGEVTNWKSLVSAHAHGKSVEINGIRFDKDMTRPPTVGPGSVITAQTTDMKYECAPGS